MTEIVWKRGDTPLPLKVNMDLTGATVVVFVRDAAGTVESLTPVVSGASAGALDVDVADLAEGRYELEVEVTQGGTVATFPNQTSLTLVVRPDLQP